jgi:hypothetical protein
MCSAHLQATQTMQESYFKGPLWKLGVAPATHYNPIMFLVSTVGNLRIAGNTAH